MLQKLKKFLNFKVEKRTNSEENAFACIAAWDGKFIGSNGLTKREYFAGLAMQGILSHESFYERMFNEVGEDKMVDKVSIASVNMADALLAALSEPKN